MNTDITLATELELSDVELETVVGGQGSLIGAIYIVNDSPQYDSGNTVSWNNNSIGQSSNTGNFTARGQNNGGIGYTVDSGNFNYAPSTSVRYHR